IRKNRVYLPQSELQQFGIAETDLFNFQLTDNFKEFIRFQIDRTRSYYSNAEKGISMLNKDSRLPVALASENYSRILNKIEENDYNVFERRAYLNSREKLYTLPRVMYMVS
ncbi:MAG: squalene/phytoene synthase family protein, partial [Balneolaceae bacterium]